MLLTKPDYGLKYVLSRNSFNNKTSTGFFSMKLSFVRIREFRSVDMIFQDAAVHWQYAIIFIFAMQNFLYNVFQFSLP